MPYLNICTPEELARDYEQITWERYRHGQARAISRETYAPEDVIVEPLEDGSGRVGLYPPGVMVYPWRTVWRSRS